MIAILLFLICITASSVGAVVGAGGGVIIKPALDMFGLLPVATVSFCSGCTVLGMSISSLIRNRRDGIKLQLRTSTALAIGAVAGGLLGQSLFDHLMEFFGNERLIGAIQSIILTIIMILVFLYVCKKDNIKSKKIDNIFISLIIGLVLGMTSAFLGIGGGPANVAVLFYFFSMNAKEAAKNSLYIIIFSQLASLFLALGSKTVPQFQWIYLISMIAGGISGAMVGSMISKKMDNTGVEKLLKGLLILIIIMDSYNILKYTVL